MVGEYGGEIKGGRTPLDSSTSGGIATLPIRVLALDLECALITDAMSALPRPGLFDFLTFCQRRFARLSCSPASNRRKLVEILT